MSRDPGRRFLVFRLPGLFMNILSLEGGGIRGIMQATILSALPNARFDLIAGTSVGSIVGGCRALGIDPLPFFTKYAQDVFSGQWWVPVPRLWSAAKYSDAGLKTALQDVVGSATLADCKIPFIATAFEMKTGRLAYFQSYGSSSTTYNEIVIGPDSHMPMVDVMMSSSAAQSYFPGHVWGAYLFWDGGSTGLNAPDMLALTEARQLFGMAEPFKMLSLGNGKTPWPYAGKDMTNPSIATVLQATIDIAYSGPEDAMVWLAAQELGKQHYRLDPAIADYAIDATDPGTLAAMQGAARACMAANPESIAAFA